MKQSFILCLCWFFFLNSGCAEKEQKRRVLNQQEIDERLIELNQELTQKEKREIEAYVKKQKWPVEQTGTGLNYWIYQDSLGASPKSGQEVEVSFLIELLDGTLCYKTREGETKKFKVEASDVESGLHELIQLMSPGDKAKAILPAHLAYGFTGDMKNIPLHSTLVYDIQLHHIR